MDETRTGEMEPSGRDVLVVGAGRNEHGDEGIGCAVVSRLAGMQLKGVETCCQDRGISNLAERWTGYEAVYLIEAMRTGAAPGSVQRFDGHTALLPDGFGLDRKQTLFLRRAIELSRGLGTLPDHLVLFGVEIAQRAVGGGLSRPVEATADRLAQRIASEIGRLRHPTTAT